MINKEHLEIEGINKILEEKKTLNNKRSLLERWEYCYLNKDDSLNPNWVTGFTDGEGTFSFYVGHQKNNSKTLILDAEYSLSQETHDRIVLDRIVSFFNCGYVRPKLPNNVETYDFTNSNALSKIARYRIKNRVDLASTISSFFENYPLLTIKRLDFLDWKALIHLKNQKAHLTAEGFLKIQNIRAGMNKFRNDEKTK